MLFRSACPIETIAVTTNSEMCPMLDNPRPRCADPPLRLGEGARKAWRQNRGHRHVSGPFRIGRRSSSVHVDGERRDDAQHQGTGNATAATRTWRGPANSTAAADEGIMSW